MQNHRVITVITKRGNFLNAFEGDSITTEIQRKGEYDSNTLDSLRDILGNIQPQTSLDVGANIGNHALVIAQYSKNLLAFEPVEFIYDVLQSNIDQNHLKSVIALNLGLSNEELNRDIFIPQNGNLGCSSLEAVNGEGTLLQIKTIIGDSYLQEHHANKQIDFIKMDVEGHEAAALMGLESTIQRHQPLLLIEWKSKKTIASFKEGILFNRLFAGYCFYSLSYTDNKKVHANNMVGFCKRILYKLFDKKWCLSSFDSEKNYSNVYLVPKRYQPIFRKFRYLES